MSLISGFAPAPSSRATVAIRALGFALLAFVAYHGARLAWWAAFSSFRTWDDEGYFQLALRAFQDGGGLYERIRGVYYGPLYFQAIAALAWVTRLEIDSEHGRWLMLLGWAAGLASAAYAAWRLTRSSFAPALFLALALPYLVSFTNEPLHATSVVLLILAPLVLAIVGPLGDGKAPRAPTLALCGALCAAMLLVKSNLGLYFTVGVIAALAAHARGRGGNALRVATASALLALPFATMSSLLGTGWVLDFALLVAIALVPFAFTLFRTTDRSLGGREMAWACAGFVVVLALSFGASAYTGTTLHGAWRSLVVEALEFPAKNHYEPALPTRVAMLLTSAAIPLALALALRRNPSALAVARLAASAFLLQEGLRMQAPFASLPFVWIASSGGREGRSRYALGVLTVLAALQAYPIPGCQVGLYALLVVLVGTVGLYDAVREVPQLERVPQLARRAIASAFLVGAALYLAAFHPVWSDVRSRRERWELGVRLDLPGTGPLRLAELDVARVRWVAENLRENTATFVGAPGMHSFHAWSGVPPPVTFYKHHWVLFRDADEEAALARSLTSTPRAGAVRNEDLIGFWLHTGLSDGPVVRALDASFERVGAAGDYELLLPRGEPHRIVLDARPLAGFEELRQRHRAGEVYALTLPALGDTRVTRLTIVNTKSGFEPFDTALSPERRHLVVTDFSGAELLREPGAALPDTDRIARFLVLCPKVEREFDTQLLVVRAYGADGEIVARCVVQSAAGR